MDENDRTQSIENPLIPPRAQALPREAEEAPSEEQPGLRLVMAKSGYQVDIRRSNSVLGRHSDADVRLPLPDVSRRHCRFFWLEGSWQVVDLNSTNGLYLNGRRVYHAALHAGDVLAIGAFTFEIHVGDDTGCSPSRQSDEVLLSIARALPGNDVKAPERRRAS